MRQLLVALVATAVLASGSPVAAQAPEETPEQPTREQLQGLDGGYMTARTVVTTLAKPKCRKTANWVAWKNVFGATVWKFTRHIRWCYNGRKVTSAKFWTDIYIAWFTNWEYMGIVSKNNWGCIGCRRIGKYRKGRFKICIVWYCVSKYPWISQTGYGDGSFRARRGCDC